MVPNTEVTNGEDVDLTTLDKCRICHCGREEGKLDIFCKCVGNGGAQHRKCLQKWIEMPEPRLRNKCEICLHPYTITYDFNYNCFQWRCPHPLYVNCFRSTPFEVIISILIIFITFLACVLDIWATVVLFTHFIDVLRGIRVAPQIHGIETLGMTLLLLFLLAFVVLPCFVALFLICLRNEMDRFQIATSKVHVHPFQNNNMTASDHHPDDGVFSLDSVSPPERSFC